MGELAGTYQDSPEAKAAQDRDGQAVEQPEGEGKVKTHIDGVFADALNKRDNLPVFKVGHDEFYQNMQQGRQRLRFKTGSNTQKFMQGSRYKQAFWIQHDKDGYMRKVK